MAGNDFGFTVYVLSGLWTPDAEVLVPIFGCRLARCYGYNILLRYEISFELERRGQNLTLHWQP